jgi:hypothetical protein
MHAGACVGLDVVTRPQPAEISPVPGACSDLTERYGDRFWTAHLDVTDT